MTMKRISCLLAAVLALASGLAAAQAQGVAKTEITVGTIQDLSGPLAGVSKQTRNGMQLRADELNEQGGVQGRKIKLLVEDSSYDPKKAVLAAQKLVQQDKIFAMLGHIGTATNMAAMPVLFEKNVINFYPLSGAREMYEPLNRLKVAFLPNNYDQMRIAAPRVMLDRNLKKPCIIHQDDEFGLEILRGAESGLKTIGVDLAEKTSYKRGSTDFSSQVAKMKAAGCDIVLLGTVVRETVGTILEARKTGFNPVFLSTNGGYTDTVPRLGGKAMDGLLATMTAQIPYPDESIAQVRFWASKYRTKYNEDPTEYAVYGYHVMDAFIRIAQKAGPELTTETFLRALDSTMIPRDMFGISEAIFSPTKRLGNPYARLSQLQDGRWRVISDYITFNRLKVSIGKDGRMNVTSDAFKDSSP